MTGFGEEKLACVFRTWSAAHQLDLLVQKVMQETIKGSFRKLLLQVKSYLLRKTLLRAQMSSRCPSAGTTRREVLVVWLVGFEQSAAKLSSM